MQRVFRPLFAFWRAPVVLLGTCAPGCASHPRGSFLRDTSECSPLRNDDTQGQRRADTPMSSRRAVHSICGTFGCTLPDKHSGLHLVQEQKLRTRGGGSVRPSVRLGIDDTWSSGSARSWSSLSSEHAAQSTAGSKSRHPDVAVAAAPSAKKAQGQSSTSAAAVPRLHDAVLREPPPTKPEPAWWARARESTSHRPPALLLPSADWARSVQSLVHGAARWRQIEGIRDFYARDDDYLALLLVLAGRTIDLQMGVPHGDAPFCPRTFVLAVSTLAHKLYCNKWCTNENAALFFDVPCPILDLYEQGICELLHAHSSLYVSQEQRAACIEILRQRGLILPAFQHEAFQMQAFQTQETSPSASRSSTPPMPSLRTQAQEAAWAQLDGVHEPERGDEDDESDAEVDEGAFSEIEVESLLSAFLCSPTKAE